MLETATVRCRLVRLCPFRQFHPSRRPRPALAAYDAKLDETVGRGWDPNQGYYEKQLVRMAGESLDGLQRIFAHYPEVAHATVSRTRPPGDEDGVKQALWRMKSNVNELI